MNGCSCSYLKTIYISLISKTYHLFDASKTNLSFEIGASKNELLTQGLIYELINKKSGKIEYHGPDDCPFRVSVKDGLVSQIWFTSNTPFILNNINIFDKDLSIASEIIDSNFKKIEIKNIEDIKMNKHTLFHTIYRDFNISMIAIIGH